MIRTTANIFISIFSIFCFTFSYGQNFTLSGYVEDADTGETLIGVNLFNEQNSLQGTTTNVYGFYSLSLPAGLYNLKVSYLGYEDLIKEIDLQGNITLDLSMSSGVTMEEVVVIGEEEDKNISSTEMGTLSLPVDKIKKLPALLGEVDILKTLQLLPGVLSAGEGTAGFYVRGGGPDQNLVLLDEAVVYNSGHLLGFFSVFNADAIKNTTLIKGGIPANYGGRLSSVVDVQMKDGNNKNFGVTGGVGLIASRLTIEGPIKKNESSFILSGRRTYAFELAKPFIDNTDFAGTSYFFYDLNAKVNYKLSDKDRIFFSGYFGRDVLNYQSNLRDISFMMPYGNATATARWNHIFSDKLFLNTSLVYNDYDFSFTGGQSDFSVGLSSGVRDYNAKLDFEYFPNVQNQIKFGVNYTYHRLTPNVTSATSGDVEFSNDLEPKYAHEYAVYLLNDYKLSNKFSINYGLRFSAFTQVGPFTSGIDGREYRNLEPVKTYFGLEPRLFAKYNLDNTSSLKGGVTYTNQYIHLVSNSNSTLPIDVWVPSSERVAPQRGVQYAVGYFKNLKNNAYETSIELYYKDLQNQIDYGENYINDIAVEVEEEFVFGTGRAYGMELFLKKNEGRLNGWVGYTLSKTDRIFPDINDGNVFPATYDRRHDVSVVANYEITPEWEFGGAFVYGTGNTYTPVKSLFLVEQSLNVEYADRNSARLKPYHRLDIALTYNPKIEEEKKFKSSFTASIYNIYNRRNTFFNYNTFETDFNAGTAQARAFNVSLFPIIPSITWNFKWKQN
jgi:hypothetical protein